MICGPIWMCMIEIWNRLRLSWVHKVKYGCFNAIMTLLKLSRLQGAKLIIGATTKKVLQQYIVVTFFALASYCSSIYFVQKYMGSIYQGGVGASIAAMNVIWLPSPWIDPGKDMQPSSAGNGLWVRGGSNLAVNFLLTARAPAYLTPRLHIRSQLASNR